MRQPSVVSDDIKDTFMDLDVSALSVVSAAVYALV
jgi:hypothetical protein